MQGVGETLIVDSQTSRNQVNLLSLAKKLTLDDTSNPQKDEVLVQNQSTSSNLLDFHSSSTFWQITLIPNIHLFESGLDPSTFIKYLSQSGKVKHILFIQNQSPIGLNSIQNIPIWVLKFHMNPPPKVKRSILHSNF